MANEGQLRLLRKRVAAWNAWRKQTLDFYVDLSRANLSKANLSRADLSGAMSSMVETMATISDMIAELGQWLRQPASSDLPDLLTTLIQRSETISDQMVLVGGKMDALPAAVARAVVNGEVA